MPENATIAKEATSSTRKAVNAIPRSISDFARPWGLFFDNVPVADNQFGAPFWAFWGSRNDKILKNVDSSNFFF